MTLTDAVAISPIPSSSRGDVRAPSTPEMNLDAPAHVDAYVHKLPHPATGLLANANAHYQHCLRFWWCSQQSRNINRFVERTEPTQTAPKRRMNSGPEVCWRGCSKFVMMHWIMGGREWSCLLYTSPSPRDRQKSRMPSSA